jgi:hypothetical protein
MYDIMFAIDSLSSQFRERANQKKTGINGLSEFQQLRTIDLVRSFPGDPMHAFFLNTAKDVFWLWRGAMDKGSDNLPDYVISDETWKEIGREFAAARKTTPGLWGKTTAKHLRVLVGI